MRLLLILVIEVLLSLQRFDRNSGISLIDTASLFWVICPQFVSFAIVARIGLDRDKNHKGAFVILLSS